MDRFSAGTITQSMVAAEVLKLVDRKLLTLDQPVNAPLKRLVPALRPPGEVTVRELLNHTSGLPDFRGALQANQAPEPGLTLVQGLGLAAGLPWEPFNKGFFNYSESNYLALGLLIEHVRSQPLQEVLREDLFTPLGLDKTSLGEPDRTVQDRLHGYVMAASARVDATHAGYIAGSPADGLVSTTADINKFYRRLLSGQFLPPGLLAAMEDTGLGSHGLGLQRFSIGCSAGYRFGQAGSVGGYLASSISSDDGASQVSMAVTLPPLPADVDAGAAASRAGLYASQMVSASQETLDKFCPYTAGSTSPTVRE
jgi:D-alanyl-D-alanine carboxypeptidase